MYEGAYIEQNETYSDVPMQWLEYVAHTENTEIRHALNQQFEQQFRVYFEDEYNAMNLQGVFSTVV